MLPSCCRMFPARIDEVEMKTATDELTTYYEILGIAEGARWNRDPICLSAIGQNLPP